MSWRTRIAQWFDPRHEARASLGEVDFWLRDGWIEATSSGLSVTPSTAVRVPDVYACMNVLAQDVGRCPLKLRVRESGWTDARDHYLWEILHDLPNPEMTAAEFRGAMMWELLQHEAAYAEIVRRPNGTVQALWPLKSDRMTVSRDGLNRKVYTYRGETSSAPIVWRFDADRPPLVELRHPSPIHQCRDLIGLALAIDTYGAKFFANGARLSGMLLSKSGLKPGQRQAIGEAFRAMYGGVKNAHRTGVFEGDLEWKPLTSPNDEAQFHESRKMVRSLIAGAFRVPSHKINDLERATFSNIEAQDRDYVNSGLDPYLVLWEQALRRDILTTRQYPRYQALFDREALIQADAQSRAAGFAQGRQNGWYSVNDIREKLGENPVPAAKGGDDYHMNGAFTPLGAPQGAATAPATMPSETDETTDEVVM